MHTQMAALLFLPSVIFCATAGAQEDAEALAFQRSLVSIGDTARLQQVLARARRGEKVVVGVIGGSITAGARASTDENKWGSRVAQWFRDTFPQAQIEHVNAGIGATGSSIAAHRLQGHLLDHHPDLVVVEFGVNDTNNELAAETLEGVVRQVLKQPKQPAVMLLFTMNRAGGNAQEWHSKVGEHYGLPMVSFRDALWPRIEAGEIKWEDVEADEVHPNDRGHRYCADFVTHAIAGVLAELPADDDLPGIAPVPAPLISDEFEFTRILNSANATPATCEGWTPTETGPFGPGWESAQPGSVLEIPFEGKTASICFYRIKGDMGIAEVSVDEGPAKRLDAWFSADWGGYAVWEPVARGLRPGPHTLRVKLTSDNAEQSTGHRFEVYAVMVAGARE